MELYDFAAVTAVGPTSDISLLGNLKRTHTVDVQVTGTPSVLTFRMEASSDGVTWYDISGTQSSTVSMMFHIDAKPVRLIRFNVLSLTGTASIVFKWTGAS
jgi:hypothetical protein